MSIDRKPLYLLSDSQLLFWKSEENSFITSVQKSLDVTNSSLTKAAYIGASNGDNKDFYDLFVAAMDNINIHESRMISSQFEQEDKSFLEQADLVMLAGGDVISGWNTIQATGMDKIIVERYYSGAVIVGISAGAIQLGMGGYTTSTDHSIVEMLKLVPYYIDVHQEENYWCDLKRTVKQKEKYSKGFGINAGGGMIYHPDLAVEPIRYPLAEVNKEEKDDQIELLTNILLPPSLGHDEVSKTQLVENLVSG